MQSEPIPRLGWLVIVGATCVLVALLWLGRTPPSNKDPQEGLRTTPTHGPESGLFNTVVPDRHQRTPESNPATPEPADPDVIETEPVPELIAPKVQAILQEAGGILGEGNDLPMEIAGTVITKAQIQRTIAAAEVHWASVIQSVIERPGMTDDSIRSATNVLRASRAGIDAKLAQDQVVVAEKLRFLLRTVPGLNSSSAEMLLDQFVSNRFGSSLTVELPSSSEGQ